ncbi:Hypothetical protein D9617_106g078170 [Elsinoe fawcettii]|nr:Hypothetical protein D9617_106g078170 [Elsinoe fawcettii]
MRMITKVLSGKSVDVQETSTRRFLLPTPFLVVESSQDSQQLIWYTNWVEEQIRNQPDILFTTLQLDENATDEKTTDENLEIKRWQNEAVVSLWCSVAKLCSTQSSSSIEEIVNSLENSGSLRLPATNDELFYSQNLVMAIIGWQTMLFRPDIGSCPQPQLAIADETDGFRTHAQIALKQDQFRCSSKLHVFLSGFGQLLPSLSVPAFSSDEDKLALRQFTTLGASTFGGQTVLPVTWNSTEEATRCGSSSIQASVLCISARLGKSFGIALLCTPVLDHLVVTSTGLAEKRWTSI